MRIVVGACIAALAWTASAEAAPKTLLCARYYTDVGGSERLGARYRMAYDAATGRFDYGMSQDEMPPFDLLAGWEIATTSPDGLRVVAILRRDVPEDSLSSPIQVVEVDFGRSTFKTDGYGGHIDLDEVMPLPSRLSCRRLD